MQLTAEQVREARRALGLTQAELAARMGGLHKDTVRHWESGKKPCAGAYAVLLEKLRVESRAA